MDKWFKDILPDKDPYHNRGRDQMRKKGGPEWRPFTHFPPGGVAVPTVVRKMFVFR